MPKEWKKIHVEKRRRIVTRGGNCSVARGEDDELALYLDRGSCDKEEEYPPISEEAEEEEAPNPGQDYGIPVTPHTSPKVRSIKTSPCGFANPTNNNSGTSRQGTPTREIFNSIVTRLNRMDENDVKLSIFNGNGLEDLEQHWFLYEAIWTV